MSPVQVPLIQTPLGQTDSESDTDSSSGFSTPTATSGESAKEETTTEKRPVHSRCCSEYIIFNLTSKCKCNLFTHEAPESSNWNLEMLVFVEGGKPECLEKNPWSRDENQQHTQPTYDAESGNQTRATLVGGVRSYHYAIPAPTSAH